MIKHFPNFVCWEEVISDYDEDRDLVFLDGISCYVLGLLLVKRGNYYSGPQMGHVLKTNTTLPNYFLLANDIKNISENRKIILPFKDSFEGDTHLIDFINNIPKGSNVIIGISSPKQNFLANYLFTIRDDLEYICLGAAVQLTWGFKNANTILRGTGLQFLEFFILQPRRTVFKHAATWAEMFSILFSFKKIKKFKAFVEISKRSRGMHEPFKK